MAVNCWQDYLIIATFYCEVFRQSTSSEKLDIKQISMFRIIAAVYQYTIFKETLGIINHNLCHSEADLCTI